MDSPFIIFHKSNPYMDPQIWSKLPSNLLDRILAFLPPAAFFRSRALSKRCHFLLFSTSFLHLYLHLSPSHPSFIFFPNQNDNNPKLGFLFDPQDLTWHRLDFSFIPDGFSPACASGGLVCWISEGADSKVLVLCNPLLGMLPSHIVAHRLPPSVVPRFVPSVGVEVGRDSIDVVVAGDDLISPYAVKNLTAEAFHVDAGGFYSVWGTGSCLPRLCSLDSARMVSVNSRFYCMNYSPFSVLSYDIASNTWSKIQAPMRRFLRSPSLVNCVSKLILVGAVEKSKLNIPRSLRLWSLHDSSTGCWTEIERMPPQMYAEFEGVEGNRGFESVGCGEFLVILIRGRSDVAVMFRFGTKMWRWIPGCPFVEAGREMRGFGYEPKLATPVTGLLDHLPLFNSNSNAFGFGG